MSSNTVILLTPPGMAAIAVLRLAGPGVRAFLAAHFSRPLRPNRCVHGQLRDGPELLDDPVVVLHADGKTADINLHGGSWVVQSVLEVAQKCGFQLIDGGHLPLNAHAVDADTAIERDMLAYLPLARTPEALQRLLAQPMRWREMVGELSSSVPRASQGEAIDAVLADRGLEWILRLPRVAIVGQPNVGKSTLANQLFAQERSITADLPGTTRDWVGDIANIDGLSVMLMDLPGLRVTDDAVESAAIEASKRELESVDLVIVVLDATLGDQGQFHQQFQQAIRVINKIDALGAAHVHAGLRADALPISALTGQGIDQLRKAIRRYFDCDPIGDTPACWTAEQRRFLGDCRGEAGALGRLRAYVGL